jgi:hypothetical protein
LRNGTDKQVNKDLKAARLDQLVPMPKAAAPVIRTKTGKIVTAKPTYVLEVIEGTKKTVHKFDDSGSRKEQGTE